MDNIETLIEKIKESDYWDERILNLEFSNYADSILMKLENQTTYTFDKCYSIDFNHEVIYEKDRDYSKLTVPQIPYSVQKIELEMVHLADSDLYRTVISAWPMTLVVVSKSLNIDNNNIS